MKKPPIVSPDEDVTIFAKLFSAPLVAKGTTWLPLVQLAAWPIMASVAKKRQPNRSWLTSFGIAALTTPVMLGSEWCHNLAHAAAAEAVGKPVDAIRVTWGMPLLVYHDINDRSITPRQHVIRALGGPVFNLLVLPLALLLRSRTKPHSAARDVADIAVGTNIFLPAVGMLPIPGIDGGPILKWSLVENGRTVEEADRVVRQVDGVLAPVFAAAAAWAFKKRRRLLGALLAQFAVLSFSIAAGWFREA